MSKQEELVEETAALMGPFVREMRAAFAAGARDLGLTPTEAQALWLLDLRDALTTKELARALDIDPANASTLVTKLERLGYLKRAVAPQDARMRISSLTAKGRRLRDRLAEVVAARRPAFDVLSLRELETFRDLLARVTRR
jgi:DNA-binding MarR family transcriptional regulator